MYKNDLKKLELMVKAFEICLKSFTSRTKFKFYLSFLYLGNHFHSSLL